MLPSFKPMRLARLREPFDHPDWLFELKFDGFRALAYIENGSARVVSRRHNAYKIRSRNALESRMLSSTERSFAWAKMVGHGSMICCAVARISTSTLLTCSG